MTTTIFHPGHRMTVAHRRFARVDRFSLCASLCSSTMPPPRTGIDFRNDHVFHEIQTEFVAAEHTSGGAA